MEDDLNAPLGVIDLTYPTIHELSITTLNINISRDSNLLFLMHSSLISINDQMPSILPGLLPEGRKKEKEAFLGHNEFYYPMPRSKPSDLP